MVAWTIDELARAAASRAQHATDAEAAEAMGITIDQLRWRIRRYRQENSLPPRPMRQRVTPAKASATWETVIRLGSVALAAKELGVYRSTVYKHCDIYRDYYGLDMGWWPDAFYIAQEDRRDALAVECWAAWVKHETIRKGAAAMGMGRSRYHALICEHRLNTGMPEAATPSTHSPDGRELPYPP